MTAISVLVQVWCEIDPGLAVRIDRSTGRIEVEPPDQLLRVSPLGRSAVEAACRLAPSNVTAFAVGSGHDAALRHALAAGAVRACELRCDEPNEGVPKPSAIADWIYEQRAVLVVADRIAGAVAARLGWGHLAGLEDVRIEGVRLEAVRRLERGDRERVSARLPCAVRLVEVASVAYVSRSRLAAADPARIERIRLAADVHANAGDIGPWRPARPRTRLAQADAPKPQTAQRGIDRLAALLGGGPAPTTAAPIQRSENPQTPQDMAETLVRFLAHRGQLSDNQPQIPNPSPKSQIPNPKS